jgi:hypothetical protein
MDFSGQNWKRLKIKIKVGARKIQQLKFHKKQGVSKSEQARSSGIIASVWQLNKTEASEKQQLLSELYRGCGDELSSRNGLEYVV